MTDATPAPKPKRTRAKPQPKAEQSEPVPAEDVSQAPRRVGALVILVRRAAPIAPKHLFAEYISFDLGADDDLPGLINDDFLADSWHIVDVTDPLD